MASIQKYIRKHGSEANFDENKELRPPVPTATPPGSAGRVEVYRQRVERGEHLQCEGDTLVGVRRVGKRKKAAG